MMDMMLPTTFLDSVASEDQEQISRRVSEALAPSPAERESEEGPEEVEINAELTASSSEILQGKDFESMSAEEIELAKKPSQN